MPSTGYTGDLNYSTYTPVDNTGDAYSIFKSGYKNIRFNIQVQQQIQLDASTAYNMPGLCYQIYGDTSLWLGLLGYNGLSDPLTDVYPGLTLVLPAKSDLVAYISRNSNVQNTTVTV
jgi:hypothetical protein